jgi:hypothetical protein
LLRFTDALATELLTHLIRRTGPITHREAFFTGLGFIRLAGTVDGARNLLTGLSRRAGSIALREQCVLTTQYRWQAPAEVRARDELTYVMGIPTVPSTLACDEIQCTRRECRQALTLICCWVEPAHVMLPRAVTAADAAWIETTRSRRRFFERGRTHQLCLKLSDLPAAKLVGYLELLPGSLGAEDPVADSVARGGWTEDVERVELTFVISEFPDGLGRRNAEESGSPEPAARLQPELNTLQIDNSSQLQLVVDLVALEVIIDLGLHGS